MVRVGVASAGGARVASRAVKDFPDPPLGNAWWVDPPRLMVGGFPGHRTRALAEPQLGALLDCGLRTFIDLMEEEPHWGFLPYAGFIDDLGARRGIATQCLRFPIEDCEVPTDAQMREIEAAIVASLAEGRPAYVHCWGGRGRSGVVAGIYLIRHGRASARNVLAEIARLRRPLPGRSPETEEQADFIRRYAAMPVVGSIVAATTAPAPRERNPRRR